MTNKTEKWLQQRLEELGFDLVCVNSGDFIIHKDCNIYEVMGDSIEKIYHRNITFNYVSSENATKLWNLWREYNDK